MGAVRHSPFLVYRIVHSRRCISTSGHSRLYSRNCCAHCRKVTIGPSFILWPAGRVMGQFLALLDCSWGQSGGSGSSYGCDGIGLGGGKIFVAQVVALLRAILSIDTTENNFPSLLRVPTYFYQLRRRTVFGTHAHSNRFTRPGNRYV